MNDLMNFLIILKQEWLSGWIPKYTQHLLVAVALRLAVSNCALPPIGMTFTNYKIYFGGLIWMIFSRHHLCEIMNNLSYCRDCYLTYITVKWSVTQLTWAWFIRWPSKLWQTCGTSFNRSDQGMTDWKNNFIN